MIGSPGNPGNGWVIGGGAGGGSSGQAKGGTGPFGPSSKCWTLCRCRYWRRYSIRAHQQHLHLLELDQWWWNTCFDISTNNFEGNWQNRGRAGGSGVVAIRYKQATLDIDEVCFN